jgi:hypothetical protein
MAGIEVSPARIEKMNDRVVRFVVPQPSLRTLSVDNDNPNKETLQNSSLNYSGHLRAAIARQVISLPVLNSL